MTSAQVRVGGGLEPSILRTSMEQRLITGNVASRIFQRDATLWGPQAIAEATIRLGWVDPFTRGESLIAESITLRERFRSAGVDRVVLCGMGGSSLGPEVVARWAGVPLTLLDSTHPNTVQRTLAQDLERTAVVVSSKSGTTVETRSHLAAYEDAFAQAGIPAVDRIVVVTDPGSELERHARAAGYRVFLADPEVGGRFSVFTAFGLVPATLAGADTRALLDQASTVKSVLAADAEANPAIRLAAAVCSGSPQRFVLPIVEGADAQWGLGDWIEQLVAESTGKDGTGLLPIALLPEAPEQDYPLPGNCRLVRLCEVPSAGPLADELEVAAPLGAQFLLWEVATALMGHLLGIDPFNQPDVESAKIAARRVLAEAPQVTADASPQQSPAELITALRRAVDPNGYVVIQAFLDRVPTTESVLEGFRADLARTWGVPVAVGFGPRYLHSTGQFHKGGPAVGAFLQLCDAQMPEVPIPGSDGTFGALISAQARGDREVLASHGRPVYLCTSDHLSSTLQQMREALSD